MNRGRITPSPEQVAGVLAYETTIQATASGIADQTTPSAIFELLMVPRSMSTSGVTAPDRLRRRLALLLLGF